MKVLFIQFSNELATITTFWSTNSYCQFKCMLYVLVVNAILHLHSKFYNPWGFGVLGLLHLPWRWKGQIFVDLVSFPVWESTLFRGFDAGHTVNSVRRWSLKTFNDVVWWLVTMREVNRVHSSLLGNMLVIISKTWTKANILGMVLAVGEPRLPTTSAWS